MKTENYIVKQNVGRKNTGNKRDKTKYQTQRR